MKNHIIVAAILAIASLSGCGPTYSDGYDEGYKAGYDDAELEIYDSAYEDGYDTGHSDAEYEFYDSRFVDGYEAGYSDAAAGKEPRAAPRGDDYVWLSFVGSDDVVYHKYTLPLPTCATAQTADGFTELVEDIPYWEPDISPCPICFPEQ